MSRPKCLDLFCGAGGAAMGLYRAGFDVVGVDIKPQPRFPFEFRQMDVFAVMPENVNLVWASPPCQAHTTLRGLGKAREDVPLIRQTRRFIRETFPNAEYVIENVLGARGELIGPSMLCGSHFGLAVKRHRLFETSFPVRRLECSCHGRRNVAVYGKAPGHRLPDGVQRARDLTHGREAMGIDWMDWPELTQAIPPAYSEHVGHYALMALGREAA